jgi:hypothetical protein
MKDMEAKGHYKSEGGMLTGELDMHSGKTGD